MAKKKKEVETRKAHASKFKVGSKAIICLGRLKGEKVTVIGESNLNMEHVIVVRREKGRDKIMGFESYRLRMNRRQKLRNY